MRAKVALSVVAVLLGLGLAGLVFRAHAIEQVKSRYVQELQSEARPYEVELERTRNELKSAGSTFFATHQTARLALGVRAVQTGDVALTEKMLQGRNYEPVLILDCDSEHFPELLAEASGKNWEVMLTASPVTHETNEMITAAMGQVDGSGMKRSGVFLLRDDDYSDAAVALLSGDGFRAVTRYQNSLGSGITEDGMAWLSYMIYRSTETKIENWFAQLIQNNGAMVLALDLDAVHSGDLSDSDVAAVLDMIDRNAEEGELDCASTAEIVDEIVNADANAAKQQKMYEAYIAEQQAKMAELQETIDGIYDRWDEVSTDRWLASTIEYVRDSFARSWEYGAGVIRNKIDSLRNKTA